MQRGRLYRTGAGNQELSNRERVVLATVALLWGESWGLSSLVLAPQSQTDWVKVPFRRGHCAVSFAGVGLGARGSISGPWSLLSFNGAKLCKSPISEVFFIIHLTFFLQSLLKCELVYSP